MRKFIFTATILLLISTSGAPAYADSPVGALVGAGLGGLIGSEFSRGPAREVAIATGVIFGGLVGNGIGSSQEYSTNYYGGSAYRYPGPVYYQTSYKPNYVAPPAPPPEMLAYYSNSFDTYCREFTKNIRTDNDQITERHGTVCLQPDGMWHVIRYE